MVELDTKAGRRLRFQVARFHQQMDLSSINKWTSVPSTRNFMRLPASCAQKMKAGAAVAAFANTADLVPGAVSGLLPSPLWQRMRKGWGTDAVGIAPAELL